MRRRRLRPPIIADLWAARQFEKSSDLRRYLECRTELQKSFLDRSMVQVIGDAPSLDYYPGVALAHKVASREVDYNRSPRCVLADSDRRSIFAGRYDRHRSPGNEHALTLEETAALATSCAHCRAPPPDASRTSRMRIAEACSGASTRPNDVGSTSTIRRIAVAAAATLRDFSVLRIDSSEPKLAQRSNRRIWV
jgi:hypothetical protein